MKRPVSPTQQRGARPAKARHSEAAIEDFDEIKDRLRVRLYSASQVAQAGATTVVRREADDLFAGLALDLPGAAREVGADLIGRWSRPVTDVFALALANVRKEVQFEREEVETDMGLLVCLYSPNEYASTHALWADALVADPPRHGLLVAAPNRHEILIVPIRGLKSATCLPFLYLSAGGSFDAFPGKEISKSIFWRRSNGTLELVARESRHFHVTLEPSPEYQAMVTRFGSS